MTVKQTQQVESSWPYAPSINGLRQFYQQISHYGAASLDLGLRQVSKVDVRSHLIWTAALILSNAQTAMANSTTPFPTTGGMPTTGSTHILTSTTVGMTTTEALSDQVAAAKNWLAIITAVFGGGFLCNYCCWLYGRYKWWTKPPPEWDSYRPSPSDNSGSCQRLNPARLFHSKHLKRWEGILARELKQRAQEEYEKYTNDLAWEIYIPMALSTYETEPHDEGFAELAEFMQCDVKKNTPTGERTCVIVGETGSGKTSFLHHLMGDMLAAGPSYYNYLPTYIHLPSEQDPVAYLERTCPDKDARILVLLDGRNELKTDSLFEELKDWRKAKFIYTTPPDYERINCRVFRIDGSAPSLKLFVQPLDRQSLGAELYFEAVEKKYQDFRPADFLSKINILPERAQRLTEVRANLPLLIKFLTINKRRRDINLLELYDFIVTQRLESKAQALCKARGGSVDRTLECMKRFMQWASWSLIDNTEDDLTLDEAAEKYIRIGKLKSFTELRDTLYAGDYANAVASILGRMLVKRGRNWQVEHEILQEYFAAHYVFNQLQDRKNENYQSAWSSIRLFERPNMTEFLAQLVLNNKDDAAHSRLNNLVTGFTDDIQNPRVTTFHCSVNATQVVSLAEEIDRTIVSNPADSVYFNIARYRLPDRVLQGLAAVQVQLPAKPKISITKFNDDILYYWGKDKQVCTWNSLIPNELKIINNAVGKVIIMGCIDGAKKANEFMDSDTDVKRRTASLAVPSPSSTEVPGPDEGDVPVVASEKTSADDVRGNDRSGLKEKLPKKKTKTRRKKIAVQKSTSSESPDS